MTYINDRNIITGEKGNWETLHNYPKFPVFMGTTTQDREKDVFHDMKYEIDKDTGIIQITNLPPLDMIYVFSHHDATGPAWLRHNKYFCKFISKYGDLGRVLEIGGGNGRIAKEFTENYQCESWNIIDPHPLTKSEGKINIRKSWFDERFESKFNPDTIVHSCVFEHALDPLDFLKRTFDLLPLNGKSFISIPDLRLWVEKGFVNGLNFEHNILVSDKVTEHLLNLAGFHIIEYHAYEGGWLWYAVEKRKDKAKVKPFKSMYKEYKETFMSFVKHHEAKVKRLNEMMENYHGEIYLFGAHIFSSFLLNVGLNEHKITGLLDDSHLKHGERLYGTRFISEYPEVLKNKEKVAVILNVGQHREVIVENLTKINSNIVFFE